MPKRRRTPTIGVSAMTLNAPRKARKGYLINMAQVLAIIAVARVRRVGIIMLQEVYAGQRRAWERRRGWVLVEAHPNNARGELGNAIAVSRRYAKVLGQEPDVRVTGPGYPLHFPVVLVELVARTRRLRRLVARGWDMPVVRLCGAHMPRKGVQEWLQRKAMAAAIRMRVFRSDTPGIAGLDANDRRLFPRLGAAAWVREGIDGVAFSRHFLAGTVRRLVVRTKRVLRITDHHKAVVGRARLPLSRSSH